MASAFDPSFEALPDRIAIFPLTGVLLLPRGDLPLNIFEPRYLNMVSDALGADRMIGMIQPKVHESREVGPPVYRTGCAGRIVRFEETPDGRFLITLRGVCRFDVAAELPGCRGYRPVTPDWSHYRDDLNADASAGLDRERLLGALRGYFEAQGIAADWNAIESSPDERLITCLAMICPFAPPEKQALLEAPTLAERAAVLTALVEMSAHGRSDGECSRQ